MLLAAIRSRIDLIVDFVGVNFFHVRLLEQRQLAEQELAGRDSFRQLVVGQRAYEIGSLSILVDLLGQS